MARGPCRLDGRGERGEQRDRWQVYAALDDLDEVDRAAAGAEEPAQAAPAPLADADAAQAARRGAGGQRRELLDRAAHRDLRAGRHLGGRARLDRRPLRADVDAVRAVPVEQQAVAQRVAQQAALGGQEREEERGRVVGVRPRQRDERAGQPRREGAGLPRAPGWGASGTEAAASRADAPTASAGVAAAGGAGASGSVAGGGAGSGWARRWRGPSGDVAL
ncbi:MAG: hypothetical protein R2736_17875 [Solirubrobacterales bacterium]